jgi:hypothetical protein
VLFFESFAVGVGNDKHAVAAVSGANGGSRDAIPFRVIPARGQVPENSTHPPTKQSWNVLHDDVSGPNHANDPGVFAPQAGPCSVDSFSPSGDADVLAGEAAADAVNPPLVGFGRRERFDIIVSRHVGPVLRQHAPTVGVNLHLPLAHQPGTLEAEIKSPRYLRTNFQKLAAASSDLLSVAGIG